MEEPPYYQQYYINSIRGCITSGIFFSCAFLLCLVNRYRWKEVESSDSVYEYDLSGSVKDVDVETVKYKQQQLGVKGNRVRVFSRSSDEGASNEGFETSEDRVEDEDEEVPVKETEKVSVSEQKKEAGAVKEEEKAGNDDADEDDMTGNEKVDDHQNDEANNVALKHDDGDDDKAHDDKANAANSNDNDELEKRKNDNDTNKKDKDFSKSKENEQVVVCQVNRGADLEE